MGNNTSSLSDCVLDGDIPALKTLLRECPTALTKPRLDHPSDSEEEDAATESDWARQVEEAVHTAVAMEIHSPRELQQLQIALELLLLACPSAWSSRRTGSGRLTSQTALPGGDDGLNNGDWTASHRACVTGNLSFVSFVRQQQQKRRRQQQQLDDKSHWDEAMDLGTRRDAYGLLPVDLVPPELLRTREEVAADLSDASKGLKSLSLAHLTARKRRSAAIQWLRASKAAFEARQVHTCLHESRKRREATAGAATDVADGSHEATDVLDAVSRASTAPDAAFFVELEPSQERFAAVKSAEGSGEAFAGCVHDREAPLRVRFRVPRAAMFLQGYFQLVWRAQGEPRSEEPRYEPQVARLRDELARRRMDCQPPLEPSLLASGADEARRTRRLEDEDQDAADEGEAIDGWFPLSVAHLPEESVAHVLFVACDRNLLHRSVVLSSEGVLVQAPLSKYCESDEYDSSEDGYSDSEDGEDADGSEDDGYYRFSVGGEEFRHSSAELAGKEFADVSELEAFVQRVVARRKQPPRDVAGGEQATDKDKDKDKDKEHVARPSEPLEDAKTLQEPVEDEGEGPDASDAA